MSMMETGRPADMPLEDWIATEYGHWAIWLDDPELGPKIREWANKGATAPIIERDLRKTEWWKRTTATQRTFDELEMRDPATQQSNVDGAVQELRQVVSSIGGFLDEQSLVQLAREQLRNGWRPEETVRAVTLELRKGSDPSQSMRSGIIGRSLKNIAREYALPFSDESLDKWVGRIANNEYLIEDFQNYARRNAVGMFPSLAADLERGLTVETLVDPFREMAARTLEINPANIDFSDAKWNAALNFGDDKGRRMMTLGEWGQYLRETPEYGYEYTSQAQTRAYQVVDTLGKVFGRL
jgi:hypothetical protein